MAYIKLKDVLHILDVVITDDSIKHTGKAIRKRLKELPVEDVEKVVYCKDCGMSRETEDERYLFCMQFADTVGFRAFCSYGEKKEGAEG